MKKFLICLLSIFTFLEVTNAESLCSYKEQNELKSKASNIKVKYEVEEYEEESVDYPIIISRFKISITNLTDEFYVVVTNDQDRSEKTFYSSDATDGIVTFDWDNDEDITNFVFKVYSSDKTKCPNDLYKTAYLTTPRYNPYHKLEICQNNLNFYLCKQYILTAVVDSDTFYKQLDKYLNKEINEEGEKPSDEEKDNTKISDKIFKFINDNKLYILGGIIIVIVGAGVIYYIKDKKQGGSKL